MSFVTRGNCRIHYRIDGEGDRTLLFSSSLGQSLAMWDQQVEALGPDHRIIRYDHRGHGSSESDGESATVDELALDALAVLDAIGVEKAHFVGLSLGGMVGQEIALSAPQRLCSLTLCATAAHLPPSDGWEQRAVKSLAEGMEPFVEISRGRWFTPQFCDSSPRRVEAALDGLRQVSPSGYAACCRALRDFDLRHRVHLIEVPTLLVAGAHDPSTPPTFLQSLHEQVRGSHFETVGAAHLLNIEQSSVVNSLIRRFIQERS